MKPEQRLLLALSLTLGILLTWSILFPPPPPLPSSASTFPAGLQGPAAAHSVRHEAERGEKRDHFPLGSLELGISSEGAGIRDLKSAGAPLLIDANPGFLQIEMATPQEEPISFQTSRESEGIVSRGTSPGGLSITRIISQRDDEHKLFSNIRLSILNDTRDKRKITLRIVAYRPIHFENQRERQYQEGIVLVGEKRARLRVNPGSHKIFPGSPTWITAQAKSQAIVLKPSIPFGMFHVEHLTPGSPVGWLTLPDAELVPGEKAQWEFSLYAGPIHLSELRKVGLDGAITFGVFSGIAKILLAMMNWSEGWLHNYGLAIIFVSLCIWLIFFPMTWSGIRTMKVMNQLQPEVERIRREHSKSPEKMNREILELYKKNRVNPLGGCLPLIFQMPIFISLYQVLNRSAELTGAHFLWIRDLSAPDAALRFSSEIPLFGSSLNLLPLLMAAAMFFQQQMMKSAQVALTEEQAAQQKIFKFFPLLFGFMFYGLPSGLVLYWLTNTTFSIAQQLILGRVHRG